jgi:predicted dithiol-disulfide oxidoreductase (DUF899 family)
MSELTEHPVVSREDWLAARLALLAEEKALTRQRDALAAKRRQLPWVRIDKAYAFDGPDGRVALGDLFAGRSQLVVYHFMYGPDWQAGCPGCSFWADGFDRTIVHLNHRDVTMVAVSRAPWETLEAYRRRMGWSFTWLSSGGSDFNTDFGVSFTEAEIAAGKVRYNYTEQEFPMTEAPGLSVFVRNASGDIFHTYSCYARGLDALNGAYQHLDLVPKGRDEDALPYPSAWLQRHDEYEDA